MAGVKTGISGQINNNIVTDGLIFYVDPAYKKSWTGPNSSTVNDLIGTSNGTIYNDTSDSYGINNSFAFDGTDDYIDLGTEILFNSTKSFSVFAWVKLTGYSPSIYPAILKLKTDTSTGWLMSLSNAAAYAGVVFGSSSNFVRGRTTGDISGDFIGTWKHVCLTFDGIDKTDLSSYKIYVDSNNISLVSAGSFSTVSNTSSTIGAAQGNRFNGDIGPIKVYNKTLSASEVLQNYQAQKERFGF